MFSSKNNPVYGVKKINFSRIEEENNQHHQVYSSLSERFTSNTTHHSSLRKNLGDKNLEKEKKKEKFSRNPISKFYSPNPQISQKQLLNQLMQEKKENLSKLQIIQNRIKSIEKQENDYISLLNIYNAKLSKEVKGRNFKNEIKMKVKEALKEKQSTIEEKQKKVKKLKKRENLSKVNFQFKKNIKTSFAIKSSKTQKILNNALYQEYKEHISNINHSKRNKVDTELLQSKIKNLNMSIEKKNAIKTKIQKAIINQAIQNEILKEELTTIEQEEENHINQLKETISKKNILRRHLYQSLDLTTYNDNYYSLTCCVTSTNKNLSRSLSKDNKNFFK